ncbi:DUF5131 family protein [Thalassospira xiamenensis]|uniref:ABC transporter ATP-binding protein n=1 Tax=Thalassospira xiamenensis TaxID=220697 RepID=A0ABR5XXG5_9PROT|nr:DUF5131 family protein [Thalassospira xiamenensis]KZC98267.1 ABC transporter ATP-binding protein [Thalassospira xiamenensis]KZD09705.1 ABC transporter ATP-binding protein [Thalassospira xiamenensis]
MAETEIEWTDATWNPVAGCSVMSAGCTNCYAMRMAKRLEAMGMEKYAGLTRTVNGQAVWTGTVREDTNSLQIPLTWKKPRKIFVNSMSDLFHDAVSNRFVEQVWEVMAATPHHHYQILTKRPDRMRDMLSAWGRKPLSNVWLGTSIENSKVVDRVDALRAVPSVIRFISFEPLIGSVGSINLQNIHWAIVGGESGPNARPIREEWIDQIHNQCLIHDTAFFFKQWGTWGADNKKRSKKANGRTYRGQVWDDMPSTAQLSAM